MVIMQEWGNIRPVSHRKPMKLFDLALPGADLKTSESIAG